MRTSAGGSLQHLLWKRSEKAFSRKCLQLFKEDAPEAGRRRADEFEKEWTRRLGCRLNTIEQSTTGSCARQHGHVDSTRWVA